MAKRKVSKGFYSPLDDIDRSMISMITRDPAITDQKLGDMLGFHRLKINKRRNNPAVQEALKKIREEQSKDAIALLKESIPIAIRTLITIARDRAAQDGARVSACRAILDKTLPDKVENLLKGELEVKEKSATLDEVFEKLNAKDKGKFVGLLETMLNA